ncbi:MAG TPA: hypothetical protein VFN92_12455 [Solirubrobacterales bacterium]|nr:hypothetical protein [Solirubrobacterales bacterium]
MATKKTDLRQQLLRAALACSEGDLRKTFSSEELLVAAWADDRTSWGLRGYEREYPDSNRIHRELDSRGKGNQGIVGLGLLERVRPRTYRLTPKGLAEAVDASSEDSGAREKTDRVFENEIKRIVGHPAFVAWLKDPANPKSFRDAGHFWGVAPGTPARVVRQRVTGVDETLEATRKLLVERGVEQLGDQHGRILVDLRDVERAREFQRALKERFGDDLRILTRGEFP